MNTPPKKEHFCNAEELALWAEFHRLADISSPLEVLFNDLTAQLKEARRALRKAEPATAKAYVAARSTPGGEAFMNAVMAQAREEKFQRSGAVLMFEHGTATIAATA